MKLVVSETLAITNDPIGIFQPRRTLFLSILDAVVPNGILLRIFYSRDYVCCCCVCICVNPEFFLSCQTIMRFEVICILIDFIKKSVFDRPRVYFVLHAMQI